jgi:hypothetical protein
MPNLVAYDLAGVQPMNGPTGLIFAMRSKYGRSGCANEAPSSTKLIQHSLVKEMASTRVTNGYDEGATTGGAVGFGTTAAQAGVNPGLSNPDSNSTQATIHVGRGMRYRRC